MVQEIDGSGALEVSIRDANGDEYIYWVRLDSKPNDVDEYDWAIEIASSFHKKTIGTSPAEPEDDDDLPISACEPFSRNDDEFVWAN